METIHYKKYTFDYEEENINVYTLKEIKREDAIALLFKTQELLREKEIDVYLHLGTLLGAVRDKDFCKGDSDIDLYIKDEEGIIKNLPYFAEHGFYVVRYLYGHYFSFRSKDIPNMFIDLFIMSKRKSLWGTYCYKLGSAYVPKKYLRDGTIEFLGREFKCPKNPEKVLNFWYGDTWRTPQGKFDKKYIYTVKSHYYYKRILQLVHAMFRAIVGNGVYKKIQNKKYHRTVNYGKC